MTRSLTVTCEARESDHSRFPGRRSEQAPLERMSIVLALQEPDRTSKRFILLKAPFIYVNQPKASIDSENVYVVDSPPFTSKVKNEWLYNPTTPPPTTTTTTHAFISCTKTCVLHFTINICIVSRMPRRLVEQDFIATLIMLLFPVLKVTWSNIEVETLPY